MLEHYIRSHWVGTYPLDYLVKEKNYNLKRGTLINDV